MTPRLATLVETLTARPAACVRLINDHRDAWWHLGDDPPQRVSAPHLGRLASELRARAGLDRESGPDVRWATAPPSGDLPFALQLSALRLPRHDRPFPCWVLSIRRPEPQVTPVASLDALGITGPPRALIADVLRERTGLVIVSGRSSMLDRGPEALWLLEACLVELAAQRRGRVVYVPYSNGPAAADLPGVEGWAPEPYPDDVLRRARGRGLRAFAYPQVRGVGDMELVAGMCAEALVLTQLFSTPGQLQSRVRDLGYVHPERLPLHLVVDLDWVRGICPDCRLVRQATDRERLALQQPLVDDALELAWGEGCDACLGRGYAGWLPVVDARRWTPDLPRAPGPTRRPGVFAQGLERVRRGETTLEELLRIT